MTLEDTLSISSADTVVLHSEHAIEVREALLIGSEVSTEDSILLRDYLRLFASIHTESCSDSIRLEMCAGP